MDHRPLGPTPREVPVIGQGTWYIDGAHRPDAVAALRRGFDLGMAHIDTAEMYGDAEVVVGEAIAGRRDEVFLVSKVLPSNASRAGTVAACERSLARLRTDRLDCYLLHWPGSHPLEDTFAAFEQFREQGKILSWGVSNFDVPDLDAAWRAGAEGQIACNQVLYHLSERAIEHAVLPWCEKRGVAVVAYSPFGHGDFPGPRTPGGRAPEEIAARHGATVRQVALRFLVRRPSVFTIPKASSPEHAADNAAAGVLRLTDAELARIDAAFPARPPAAPPSHAVSLRTGVLEEQRMAQPSDGKTHGAERGLTRFEGFSDAVFAIALTLLIVEIKVPGSPEGPQGYTDLARAMAEQWREHLALVVCYFVIGAYWLQHHYTGRIYDRSDHGFSALNLLFLLAIVVIPYPIRAWCFHFGTRFEDTASAILVVGLALTACTWMAKWFYAMTGGRRVMDDRLAPDFLRQMTRRYGAGTLTQIAAIPLALVAPRVGVVVALLCVAFFLLPQPKPRYNPGEEPSQEEQTSD